ncbi:MAG: hypothetical protein U5O39_05960 [Gammaproteobacteria bacterium]|nr:hypothetical protein [Gammaproteobacteria bacterium]
MNEGWAIGKRLLQYERSVRGGVNTSGQQVEQKSTPVPDLAKQYIGEIDGRIADTCVPSAPY